MGLALTLRVRGEDDTLSSNTLCLVCNLFAYTHSSLKPSLCFGFQGYIPLRLPAICVFVYALHSVVKPTHASVFITSLRFIQTIASLKGFDHTIRSITLLVSTPRVLHARQDNTHCHYFAHAKIILPNIRSCVSMLPNSALHIPI